MNDQTCATCRHFEVRTMPSCKDWCAKMCMFLPSGCRGCPAWEAKPEPKDWSEEAAEEWREKVARGTIPWNDRTMYLEWLVEVIRRHHDAACKPREPDYEKMAKWLHEGGFLWSGTVEFIAAKLREADGGGR